MLYAADIRGVDVSTIVADEALRAVNEPERIDSWLYARDIVDGVHENLAEIDAAITGHAQGWTLERMPAVDRAILRVAVWEITHNDEVPTGVAIAEAVALAGQLGTDESAGFINGLLGSLA